MILLLLSSSSLKAQSCTDLGILIREEVQIDCYTTRVNFFFSDYSPGFSACNMEVSGRVSGPGIQIESIGLGNDFTSSSIDGEEFTLSGPASSTFYEISQLMPPSFSVVVSLDPDETFTIELTDVTFDLSCSTSCEIADLDIKYIGSGGTTPVVQDMDGPATNSCSPGESRNIEVFLDYPSPSTVNSSSVTVPLKIKDLDDTSASTLELERLDLRIDYTDVYGGLEIEYTSLLTGIIEDFILNSNEITSNIEPSSGASFTIALDGTTGTGTIGEIEVTLPDEPLADGEIDFSFDYARLQEYSSGGGGVCCSPAVGADGTVTLDIGESFPCEYDNPAGLVRIGGPVVIDEETWSFPVYLEASSGATDAFTLSELLIEVELVADGDLEISTDTEDAGTEQYCTTTSCTSSGSEFPQNGECIEVRNSGETVVYGLCTSTSAGYPTKVFDIIVTGSCGCIEALTINRARWNNQTLGSDGLCVLDIEKGSLDDICLPRGIVTVNSDCSAGSAPMEGVDICRLDASTTAYNCIADGPCTFSESSDADGFFAAPDCRNNESYKLAACKNDNILCGVSAFDLVLLSQHILGIEYLSSTYLLIAADVNNSGSITTLDLIEIRKVILGLATNFPNNVPSWRFIACDYSFTTPASPWGELDEAQLYDYSLANGYKPCFNGVKMGDMNCNADSEECFLEEITEDFEVHIGRLGTSPSGKHHFYIAADTVPRVAAFQFALRFDTSKLGFDTLLSGDLPYIDSDNFNFTETDDGLIRVAWFDEGGSHQTLSSTEDVFGLAFDELDTGDNGLEGFTLDTTVMKPVIYFSDSTFEKIELVIDSGGGGGGSQQSDNGLASNPQSIDEIQVMPQPNPFTDRLQLQLQLPEKGSMQMQILDATGKVMWQQAFDLGAGKHSLNIKEALHWPSGIYYYRVNYGDKAIAGKIIKSGQ